MSKAKVAVVTDSTACLTPEDKAKYNIKTIPLSVNWDGDTLKDGIDITADEFYSRLGRSSSMPSTSQPSIGEFVDFYNSVGEEAETIVGVFISSELSGTIASATAAVDNVDMPVEVVDSKLCATPLGLIAMTVAEAVQNGASAAEAAAMARELRNKGNVIFLVDTLEFLHRGGRIGGARRLVGSMLSIKPLLSLTDGRVDSMASIRTKKKAIAKMLEELNSAVAGKPAKLGVLHSSDLPGAEKLKQTLQSQYPGAEVVVNDITPVVGTHVGPGALGVAYLLK